MPDGTSSDYGHWSAGEGSFAIEYSCAVLGDIRVLVVDGLHRLSRGGIEVGGILYGTRSAGGLRIEAQQPIECEHARGPSFTLSHNDLAGLERLLASAQAGAPGLEPLGWYHSHTRTGISLSEEDLKVCHRSFPHPWQVALVLHPEKFGPVTAGFFIREADGSIRAESSYQEFEVLAVKARTAAPPVTPRASAATAAAPAPRATPPPTPQPPPTPAAERKAQIPMPGKTPGRAPIRGQEQPLRILAASENRVAANAETLGDFLKRLEPRRSRGTRWIVGALLCAAAFFLGLSTRSLWLTPNAAPALSLRAFDQGGQLRVEWDRTAEQVRDAQSGVIEIDDGGEKANIPLDREHLLSGSISYARRSTDVDVRLRVNGSKGTAQEVTRFVGPPSPSHPGRNR